MMKTLSLATMITAVLLLPAMAENAKPTIDPSKSGPTDTMTDQTPQMKGPADAATTSPGTNSNPASDAMGEATPTMKPTDRAAAAPGAAVKLSAQEAEKWIDKTVYSSDDKNLGEVSAFVRGSDDTVSEMHADIGGFLGLGEKRVQLTPAQFRLQDDRVILNLTAEQAKTLPPVAK